MVCKISSNPSPSMILRRQDLLAFLYSVWEPINSISIHFSPTQQNQVCSRESLKKSKEGYLFISKNRKSEELKKEPFSGFFVFFFYGMTIIVYPVL